jgi:hypothetical protein
MADWFTQKRYGYGAGLPISWQGWVAILVYMAVVLGASLLVGRSPWAAGSAIVTATAILLVVCARTTRGGWRWRWGDKD